MPGTVKVEGLEGIWKTERSGELLLFNAVVHYIFFSEKICFLFAPNWSCRLATSVFSDEAKTSMGFMANSQAFMYFLTSYSQRLYSVLTDELLLSFVCSNGR